MRKKTVEVPQLHDIDKIVRRCCAETEEGQTLATKTADAHLVQYIDRVKDVPADEELGDAEDAGSCCTKCYSDVEPVTDIPPESIATIAFRAQTTETLRT